MAIINNNVSKTVIGTDQNDTIKINSSSPATVNTAFGFGGNDTYYIDVFSQLVGGNILQDVVIEQAGGGTDTVIVDLYIDSTGTEGNINPFTLFDNVENLIARSALDNNSLGFRLNGNNLANNISFIPKSSLDFHAVTIDGGAGNDTLTGGNNSDGLIGGTGADRMLAGLGDDFYFVDNTGDVVIELAGEGNLDTVYARGINYTLSANVEALGLDGTENINGTGNVLDNSLQGNNGNNVLSGAAGNDVMYGLDGNDKLLGDDGNDTLSGGNGRDTLLGGLGNDELQGGNDGEEDSMDGGGGDDFYWLSEAIDTISDTSGGEDTVNTTVELSDDLFAGVENLILSIFGGPALGVGNGLDNYIQGNNLANILKGLGGKDSLFGDVGNDELDGGDGNDTLDGGVGADLMIGGLGNDTYFVDDANDAVEEDSTLATEIDSVFASVNFELSSNVENLTLLDGAANARGNKLNNLIIGNSTGNFLLGDDGNDTLDGGLDNDVMDGGNGADIYLVDNQNDSVADSGTSGEDVIRSQGSFDLLLNGAGVEHLELFGGTSGIGNSLNNKIINKSTGAMLLGGWDGNDSLYGGIANDTLRGGTGADLMDGGAGNDLYEIDDVGDRVIELANGGTDDLIESAINFDLNTTTHVESLRLIGIVANNATGNALNNTLEGNSNDNLLIGNGGNDNLIGSFGLDTLRGGLGNDTLFGGADVDSLEGGAGDDIYLGVQAFDVVVELANQGIDTVEWNSSGTLDLRTIAGGNIENATLSNAAITLDLTGNTNANILIGNANDNILAGLEGNDTLNGGGGSDVLLGGTGNDMYFTDGLDTITEQAGEGTDTVMSSASFFALNTLGLENVENLTLLMGANDGYGNNLNNTIIGNSGNNYLSSADGNDTLQGGDGNDTLDGGIGLDSLVGGNGNDTYLVDNATDKIVEAAKGGIDNVNTSVSLNFAQLANIEKVTSNLSSGNLTITGDARNNIIDGETASNDRLLGSAGNDTLIAGDGQDTLTGGAGSDVFNFDNFHTGFGVGTVTDFVRLTDKIQLTGFGLNFTGAGNSLEASQFKLLNAFTGVVDATDRIIFDVPSGNLYYDSDGDGAAARIQLMHFDNGVTISSTNIFG